MVSKKIRASAWVSLPLTFLAGSALLLPTEVEAQMLYCCEVKGKRTCGDTLPTACIGQPYTVRGLGGKLIKSVEAPLTPEQLKAREELEKRKKEEEVLRKEQARLDAALLATYSSEAEIDKGRERMEADFMASIKAAEGRIAAAEKRKRTAIGDPELYKKRGMPDDLKRQVQDIDFEIRTQTELLESKKKDLDAGRLKFAEDRQRYLDLKARRAARR
jgi:hypothetical protein